MTSIGLIGGAAGLMQLFSLNRSLTLAVTFLLLSIVMAIHWVEIQPWRHHGRRRQAAAVITVIVSIFACAAFAAHYSYLRSHSQAKLVFNNISKSGKGDPETFMKPLQNEDPIDIVSPLQISVETSLAHREELWPLLYALDSPKCDPKSHPPGVSVPIEDAGGYKVADLGPLPSTGEYLTTSIRPGRGTQDLNRTYILMIVMFRTNTFKNNLSPIATLQQGKAANYYPWLCTLPQEYMVVEAKAIRVASVTQSP